MPRIAKELTPEVIIERYNNRVLKQKAWIEANKESQTIKLKSWYEANKERLNKRSTELRREKREALKAQQNPEN